MIRGGPSGFSGCLFGRNKSKFNDSAFHDCYENSHIYCWTLAVMLGYYVNIKPIGWSHTQFAWRQNVTIKQLVTYLFGSHAPIIVWCIKRFLHQNNFAWCHFKIMCYNMYGTHWWGNDFIRTALPLMLCTGKICQAALRLLWTELSNKGKSVWPC